MKQTKQVELTTDEQKIFNELIDLFNSPVMDFNLREDQKKVFASLGVGIYRQVKQEAVERERISKILSAQDEDFGGGAGHYQPTRKVRG